MGDFQKETGKILKEFEKWAEDYKHFEELFDKNMERVKEKQKKRNNPQMKWKEVKEKIKKIAIDEERKEKKEREKEKSTKEKGTERKDKEGP